MPPEQVRGSAVITSRADVFALGAVLFECLVGRPAFEGATAHAILAKILSGELPRLCDHRPDTPAVIETLLSRMLAHDPADRLSDGAAVVAAISGLLSDTPRLTAALTETPPVSNRSRAARSCVYAHTAGAGAILEAAVRAAAELGAEIRALGGGVMATFAAAVIAEAAQRAAHCALVMREVDSRLALSIVTSRGDEPSSDVERDVTLASARVAAGPGEIRLDTATARCLSGVFLVSGTGAHCTLLGHRGASRADNDMLLGRARETAALEGGLAAVIEDQRAHVVIVLGGAGMGKSKLLDELGVRARRHDQALNVISARADRPTSTTPFAIVAQLLRGHIDADSDVLTSSRQVFRAAMLARGLGELDAEFCCELAGFRASEDAPELADARRDPLIMADGFRSGWLSFLQSVLELGPLVLLVDDLHLVDPPSLHFLTIALEQLADERLLIVGTARAEDATMTAIFEKYGPELVALRPLRPHLARQLVAALVPGMLAPALDRLVERAAGNPLCLCELARLGDDLQSAESLFAAIQLRMSRLAPSVQRVLRAGSVFGMRFRPTGIAALLGGSERDDFVRAALDVALAEHFVTAIEPSDADAQWSFASALTQEAAYDTLPPAERRAAHAAAGGWLEARSGEDSSIIAWHFERGEAPARALPHYVASARAALRGRELERAMALTQSALECAPAGSELASVLVLRAEAALAQGNVDECKQASLRGMDAASRGSLAWLTAAGLLITSAGQRGDNDELVRYAERVRDQPPEPEAVGAHTVCLCRAASQVYALGRFPLARELVRRAEHGAGKDLLGRAWVHRVRAGLHLVDDEYDLGIDSYRDAVQMHAAAGDLRGACQARILKASFHVFAGDFEDGETELDVAEGMARRSGADYFVWWASYTRGKILALAAEPVRAREQLERVRSALATSPRIVAGTHIYLALAALRAADFLWAETEARGGLRAHAAPSTQAQAYAVLARALVGLGRPSAALEAAEQATEILASVGRVEENESVIHLARIEALLQCGREQDARSCAQVAIDRLVRIAKGLRTPSRRQGFFERVESHGTTMRFAHELGVRVDVGLGLGGV
jgi:tetratricopeptide (TPR) repeat protein